MIPQRLRLPPYGRELLALRKCGLVPQSHPWFGHIIVVLDDWQLAVSFPDNRIVIPADLDPAHVNFAMIAGLDIVLVWSLHCSTIARRNVAIQAIMRCKPTSLRIVDMDAPRESFWVLSHGRGLERPELLK